MAQLPVPVDVDGREVGEADVDRLGEPDVVVDEPADAGPEDVGPGAVDEVGAVAPPPVQAPTARATTAARPASRAVGSVLPMGPDANPAALEVAGRPAVRRRVVLDVDTGVDDACALLLAALSPDLDLVAVTCVGGNADVDQVVANTLLVLGTAGRDDVPVARGAARPLLEAPVHARHVHGEDGLADLGWPRSPREADPRHAVELLRDVLLDAAVPGPDGQDRRVTLVPLAPLTNVALLLRTHPEAAAGLREVVFMGGAADVGNATASAEFNVFHDPEAAALVLDTATDLGVPVTMWGLDVFSEPRVTRAEAQALVAVGGRGRPSSPDGSCCTSATGSAPTTRRSATRARSARSSTPTGTAASGARSASS